MQDYVKIKIAEKPQTINKCLFGNYRKKPIVIKAVEINESFEVNTIEGNMKGKPGDFLIIGVQGELYPCDRQIFIQTYDHVETVAGHKEVVAQKQTSGLQQPQR
jgi:hypothetical protein